MGRPAKIAPSMLSSDFANLASEAQRMLDCGADWLHMDIMVCWFICHGCGIQWMIELVHRKYKLYLFSEFAYMNQITTWSFDMTRL